MNTPECYIIHTLPVLFVFILYAFGDILYLKNTQKIVSFQVNNLWFIRDTHHTSKNDSKGKVIPLQA